MQAEHLPVYDDLRARVAELFSALGRRPGDPAATSPAILKVVDAEEPPLRIFFGTGPLDLIRDEYAQRIRHLGAVERRLPDGPGKPRR